MVHNTKIYPYVYEYIRTKEQKQKSGGRDTNGICEFGHAENEC